MLVSLEVAYASATVVAVVHLIGELVAVVVLVEATTVFDEEVELFVVVLVG